MLKRTLAWYFSGWYLGRSARLLFATAVLLAWTATPVWAQVGDDDADDKGEVAEPDVPMAEEAPVDPDALRHGIGLRLRYVFVPKGLIELFMEEAAGGMGNPGFGLDYIRRRKNFEFSVGFEYDKLSGTEGFYVESGGSALQGGTTDFVEFDDLAWFTIDASFVYHHPLSKLVSLRYGGGIGLGIVTGEVIKTDAVCTGPDAQSDCAPVPAPIPGGDFNSKQDFFRFPPVFNLLGGVQLTPAPNVAINFELGMRTVFYSGISGQYFF